MRLILWSAAVLVLVSVLTVVVILRRGGRAGEDLLAAQMRTVAGPQPVPQATSLGPARSPDGIDDATWRRIGELAVSGRRLQAIELLKTTTGCRLTEAKAVVDRLTRPDAPAVDRSSPQWHAPGVDRSSPQWDASAVDRTSPQWDASAVDRSSPQWDASAVDRTSPQWDASAVDRTSPQRDAPRLMGEVRELAHQGRTAEAIQLLRDGTGMTRPEAEAAIEHLAGPEQD